MRKLEELKAALEAAIEEDRIACETGTACTEALMDFADLAARAMPTLLMAASLVLECEALVREYPYIHQQCRKVLEELK